MTKITLTGISAELLKSKELEVGSANKISELRKALIARSPDLKAYSLQISVNSILASEDQSLEAGDEVLVFGPFAGG